MAVGSPLSPVLTDVFVEDFEETVLAEATHKPLCWFHYVDDTFVIWPQGTEKPERFLDHLKGIHRNIRFTVDTGWRPGP